MFKYRYEAKTLKGSSTSGVIEANDENHARVLLRAKHLIPLKIKMFSGEGKGVSKVSFFTPKVSSKELQIFTRQFATLINSGIPILDSLKILSEGATDKLIKEALTQIKNSIETGRRLSDSMAAHPRVFDTLYCNMIRAGEEAGILDIILERLSTYSEKNEKIKNQVKGALIMPTVIIIAAIVIIIGIVLFIIPKFEEFYKSSGKGLPALTQMVINISTSIRSGWFWYLAVIAVAVYFIYNFLSSKDGKIAFDRFIINSPVFGPVIQKSSVARMTRTLSTLLTSGVNLIDAIDIASKTAGNHVIELALESCKNAVMVGKPFHFPLSKQKEIPPMVAQMVAIGEQSGSLDAMLGKVADFYEDEVENAVRAMTTLIEPLLMMCLGGIIAFILVAMYLPVFQLGDTVG